MCQLKKCCCCVDLRTGAIVMAVLEIIGGLGMFAGGLWQDILSAVVTIGAGVCLLFGAIKYHQLATLVYLVLQMIAIVLSGVAMIMVIIAATAITATGNSGVQGNAVGGTSVIVLASVLAAFYGIFTSLNIYFWVCVFSFYKGLKTGKITSPV